MILTTDLVYKIIPGAIFMAFGCMLTLILENTYQLDLSWKIVLPSELAAGFWGAIYGRPILIDRLIPPGPRVTKALIVLAILSILVGFFDFSIAFFGLAAISDTCNSYAKRGKNTLFIAFKVSFDGIIVAGLSFLTGSIFFLLLVTPFLELGFLRLSTILVGWLMILASLDYSGVWLVFPLSVLASWTIYLLGSYLRRIADSN